MTNPQRHLRLARALGVLTLAAFATAGDTATRHWDCTGVVPPPAAHAEAGRLLILPGVGNTRFQFAGLAEAAARQLPSFDVEVRPWGTPFLTLHNLRAHARNAATAKSIAAELAAWRRAHPHDKLYLVGYSGGGGIATLVTASLPADVAVDRLILIAPAISPDYPLAERVLPHVRELVVSFASGRDLQVGWGTHELGTIDRVYTQSAGAVGFGTTDDRLLEYFWSDADLGLGHQGNHWSYLVRRWQDAKLLPALDPSVTAVELRAQWAAACEET
ncbi:MAG TPA: alpha/beta fold hydrolase [Gammaproteobacteria bacterium]|nr:alpha/beta fold hydrolase [Gammaproteobacteria bacterium]